MKLNFKKVISTCLAATMMVTSGVFVKPSDAAVGRIIKMGRRINYSSWWTNYFALDNKLGWCTEPNAVGKTGKYGTTVISDRKKKLATALMTRLAWEDPTAKRAASIPACLKDYSVIPAKVASEAVAIAAKGHSINYYSMGHVYLSWLYHPNAGPFVGAGSYASVARMMDGLVNRALSHSVSGVTADEWLKMDKAIDDPRAKIEIANVKGGQDIVSCIELYPYKPKGAKPVITPVVGADISCTNYTRYGGGDITTEYLHYEGSGNLTVTKQSGNPYWTDGNPAYSLSNVEFTLDGPSGTFTERVDRNGQVRFELLSGGLYTLTESVPGTNYHRARPITINIPVNTDSGTLTMHDEEWKETTKVCEDQNGREVSRDSWQETTKEAYDEERWNNGGSAPYAPDTETRETVDNEPMAGSFSLTKKARHEGVIRQNNNYTLAGAVYKLKHKYINYERLLTTDANGHASIQNIPLGEYTLTEVSAPKHFDVDTQSYDINVMDHSASKTVIENEHFVKTKEFNKFDRKQHELTTDARVKPQGDMELNGAVLECKFYTDTLLTADVVKTSTPLFSFKIRTMKGLNGDSVFQFSNRYIDPTSWQHRAGVTLDDMMEPNGELRVPIGSYTLEEVEAPEGYTTEKYDIGGQGKLFVQNIPTKNALLGDMTVKEDSHIKGGLEVTKFDNQTHNTTPQGDAVLGATFNIINKSKNNIFVGNAKYAPGDVVTTLVTDPVTKFVKSDVNLPYGTYELREVSTSDNYNLVPWNKVVSIRTDGEVFRFNTQDENAPQNAVKRGGLEVVKYSEDFMENRAEGDATLEGAEFTIINRSKEAVYHPKDDTHPIRPGEVVDVIRTNARGIAKTAQNLLPIGTYEVKETKQSQGYHLNPHWNKVFKITADNEIVRLNEYPNPLEFEKNDKTNKDAAPERIIRGGLRLYKSDKNRVSTDPKGDENVGHGDATLDGATFRIINRSSNAVLVDGREYPTGDIVKTITTDKNGIAKTDANTLPYGTYEVTEVSAPKGFFVDKGWSATVQIREEGKIYDIHSYENNPIKEEIYRGGLKLQKIDLERQEPNAQGDATLAGAEFEIYNDSLTDVYVDGKWIAKGALAKTIVTDEHGIAQTDLNSLPYGSYHVIEKKPSQGYLLNKDFNVSFEIRDNNKIIDITQTNPVNQQVIRGDVLIKKFDKELDKSEAIGGHDHGNNKDGTNLNGIVFEIKNVSKDLVLVDGVRYKPGQVVKTIMTHWNDAKKAYTAETTGKTLPYGTYEVREITTNKYYNHTDKSVKTFEIREDGKTVEVDKDGHDMVFKNAVIRGDLKFIKISELTMDRMPTLWMLKNDTTGERHVLATDINGELRTSSKDGFKHSQRTNANDKLIGDITSGKIIPLASVDKEAGVWFGLGEDGSMAPVDDNVGALPYGKYTLKELRTDSNRFFDLKEFELYVTHEGKIIDLGTISNVKIELNTKALDDGTGEHIGLANKNTVINDELTFRNMRVGKTYRAVATLMDKATKTPIVDKEGHVATATKEFKAMASFGSVMVEIPFDGENLKGKTVVVFEELFDSDGVKVGEHMEIDSDSQTVHYPSIGTTALSDTTNDHDTITNERITINDTVKYTNLIPGKKYVMSGILMDKSTGEFVVQNGMPIKNEVEFVPDTPDGTLVIPFSVDAKLLRGKTLVAFEDLKYRNIPVAVHHDINDEKQSVHIPKIGTTANFNETNSHEGIAKDDVIITDTVKYTNLIPGKTYTMNGKLMVKNTGEVFKVNGVAVTQSRTFTPMKPDGEIDLQFRFDARALEGKSVVVFEALHRDKYELTTHEDLNDEGQTINFPKIRTNASNNEGDIKEVGAYENVTINDKVKYENLDTTKEYTMFGELYDKETGRSLNIRNSVTFRPDEPSGYVTIPFTFDARFLEGKTIVAFETLRREGHDIAIHHDLEDKKQTTYVPKIRTTLIDKVTENNEGKASEKSTLIDKVHYKNLVVGNKYTVKGRLVDAESNELATAETTFTAKTVDGVVDVVFTLNTKDLEGKKTVAFEELFKDDVLIASHANIEDKDQTVTFPKVRTKASDKAGGSNILSATEVTTVVDTVKYNNLVVGKSYKVVGTLMDKKTGKPLLDNNKKPLQGFATFVPTDKDGSINIEIPIKGVDVSGKTIVVFEDLYRDGKLVGVHADIEDEDQTIYVVKIGTTATNEFGETKQIPRGKSTKIVDTVSYENLPKGEYKAVGMLVDKTVNRELRDKNGKPISVSQNITINKNNGEYKLTFDIDTSELGGHDLVVFEYLYDMNGNLIAKHHDINDEGQTVSVPAIRTTLLDYETKVHEARAFERTTLVDTVHYKNLIVGHKYLVKGKLVDKEKNEVAHAETEFVATAKEGDIEVIFNLDARELEGKMVVAFEELYKDGIQLDTHADIEDKDQTVTFPKVRTKASDKVSKTNVLSATDTTTVVDTVTYTNLVVGRMYQLKGTLMDKETGKPILDNDNKPVSATTTFIPNSSNGTVDVEIPIVGLNLAGKTIVVFEDLYRDGKIVGTHSDIHDKDQTIYVVKIGTTATGEDGETKQIKKDEKSKIVDTVKYENVVPGKYRAIAKLMDRETGEPVKNKEGKEITVSEDIELKEPNGEYKLTFELDTDELAGHQLVVFEELYDEHNYLVAKHNDINDKDQTVIIVDKVVNHTGVVKPTLLAGAVLALSVASGIGFYIYRRRKN